MPKIHFKKDKEKGVLHFRYPYVSVQSDSYSKFSASQFLVGRGESGAAQGN